MEKKRTLASKTPIYAARIATPQWPGSWPQAQDAVEVNGSGIKCRSNATQKQTLPARGPGGRNTPDDTDFGIA